MNKNKFTLSLITSSKEQGGANIAAQRIKLNLKKKFNVQSIYCDEKNFFKSIKYFFARFLVKIFIKEENYLNSLNLFSRVNINKLKGDLLILNWIGEETISIDDLIKIQKPIIWIIHDMWALTSTEHFLNDSIKKEYKEKDCSKNLLKKIIFQKKKKFFNKKNIILITNSKWLRNFARKSELTKKSIIHTVYNPIETNLWKRKNRKFAKKKLNFDNKKKYILIGAKGGLQNFRKGLDLFFESLKYINISNKKFEVIVLGNNVDKTDTIDGFKINFRKFTPNKIEQVLYHSVADLTVSPSRGESIPQFIVETLLCNNPVVSFNIGGMNEILKHKFNGYLASPFNEKDLAKGVNYVVKNIKHQNISIYKKKVLKMFNEKNNLKQYSKIINNYYLNHK